MRVRIVAEVGSNYDGDLALAKRYVKAAKAAGADAVKFQTLRHDKLFAPEVKQGETWIENPVLKRVKNLELPDAWHFELKAVADEVQIEFISTPFYLEAVDLLERVGVPYYKVASGDVTFVPLLERIASTSKPVVLSTGASTLDEVRAGVEVLTRNGAGPTTLLHCVSKYPPEFSEMNLRAQATLQKEFATEVGISDHSPGWLVPLASVALGGTFIEKHVTFDPSRDGPDHPFALAFDDFAEMVRQVRTLETALGTGVKVPSADEAARRHRFRRSPYDPKTHRPTDASAPAIWLRPDASVLQDWT